MIVTVKLIAIYRKYLPPGAQGNAVQIDVQEGSSAEDVLGNFGVPMDTSSVILVNARSSQVSYESLELALQEPDTQLRLFGKPVSYLRRRMGVALARAADTDAARQTAAEVAARVVPVSPG